MDQLSQWQIHAISDNVTHLSQQRETKAMAAVRVREGVVGKTYPFQIMAAVSMSQITTRDGDTQYINPTLTKRRANLLDFAVAALIDDFDVLKTLTNPQSEVAQAIVNARNRTLDDLILGVAGLDAAAATGTAVGGILGLATTVDEGAESTATSALPTAQQILHGGTNLTMAKIRQAGEKMDSADVAEDDRYFFYSPLAMRSLLADNQVTSSDYSSINALQQGRFPMDAVWYGFKWRMSTRLPVAVPPAATASVRSCIAVQKQGVGLAVGTIQGVEVTTAVHKWNNPQVVLKLSAGGVRIDDNCVVQVDVLETA
jgi:hypothetical protein